MKTIHNRTAKPLRIQLHGGKVLHLGPRKEGQVQDQDLERPAVKRLLEAGEIEVLDEGVSGGATGAGGGAARKTSQGHHPAVGRRRTGDR